MAAAEREYAATGEEKGEPVLKERIFFKADKDCSTFQKGCGRPERTPRATPGPLLDVKMCPGDPDLISFVRNGDLWALRASTGIELRLTFCRRGGVAVKKNDGRFAS